MATDHPETYSSKPNADGHKRGQDQIPHPAMLTGQTAATWITKHFPHFELPESAQSLAVNSTCTNAVAGLAMLLKDSAAPALPVSIKGLVWAPGEQSLRLPAATHAALRTITGKPALRSDHILDAESADLPSRVSELRNIGLPIATWNQPSLDPDGVVRQFRAYQHLGEILVIPSGRGQALADALHAGMAEFLTVQVEHTELKALRTIQNLHALAAQCSVRMQQMKAEGCQ
jgi:hypothetical protein